MKTIKEATAAWTDTPEGHKYIAESFSEKAGENKRLVELRHFVTENQWGFGEFCLYHLWSLIMDEMPKDFRFCEIGVFKSQFLCLVALLAEEQRKYHRHCIFGISPMNGAEVNIESDYFDDVWNLHTQFNAPTDYTILEGLSTDADILDQAEHLFGYHKIDNGIDVPIVSGSLNALYIDGGHSYETVTFDLNNYAPLITHGGFLVVDDACCNMNLPEGYFKGHQSVTNAVLAWEPQHPEFEFLFSVSHNKVYRRK